MTTKAKYTPGELKFQTDGNGENTRLVDSKTGTVIAICDTEDHAKFFKATPALVEACKLKRNVVLNPKTTLFNGTSIMGKWIAIPKEDYKKTQEALKLAGVK